MTWLTTYKFKVSYSQHHIMNTASEAMRSDLHNETFSETKKSHLTKKQPQGKDSKSNS
jgi:hypothetical protein